MIDDANKPIADDLDVCAFCGHDRAAHENDCECFAVFPMYAASFGRVERSLQHCACVQFEEMEADYDDKAGD